MARKNVPAAATSSWIAQILFAGPSQPKKTVIATVNDGNVSSVLHQHVSMANAIEKEEEGEEEEEEEKEEGEEEGEEEEEEILH